MAESKQLKTFLTRYSALFRGSKRGYLRFTKNKTTTVKSPPDRNVIKDHLTGKHRIGIYPQKDNKVFFACIDCDGGEAEERAKKICDESKNLGIYPIAERSSSGIGIHLWFFFQNEIESWRARRLLTTLCGMSGYKNHPEVEIFPKQDYIRQNQWGSAIALPLAGSLIKQDKTIFLDWETPKTIPEIYQKRLDTNQITNFIPDYFNPKHKQSFIKQMEAKEILLACGIDLQGAKQRGDEINALCPFHEETKPSFWLNNRELVYICFGCGAKGYIDKLVKEITGQDIREVLSEITYTEDENFISFFRDGEPVKVSDFGFVIKNLLRTELGETLREILFQKSPKKKEIRLATGTDLASAANFRQFALKAGSFHLGEIKQYEFNKLIAEKDTQAETAGIIKHHTKYGFRQGELHVPALSITKGNIYFPDDEGIFRFEKPFKYGNVDMYERFIPFQKTARNLMQKPTKTKKDLITDFEAAYKHIIKEVCLGWIFANVYSDKIKNEFGFFPILNIIGANATGKTALAEILLGFWGSDVGIEAAIGSSYAATQRLFEALQHVPCCVDDYRNTRNVILKNPLYRSAVAGMMGIKATTQPGEIITSKANANLIITGEEPPTDGALQTRACFVHTKTTEFKRIKEFYKIYNNRFDYSPIVIEEIKNRSEENWIKLKKHIEETRQWFIKITSHTRQQLCWAVPIAAYKFFFDSIQKESLRDIIMSIRNEEKTRLDQDLVADFLITLDNLIGEKIFYNKHFHIENNELRLYMPACWTIWAEVYGRTTKDQPPTKQRIHTEFSAKPYFIKASKLIRLPADREDRRRYLILDLDKIPPQFISRFLINYSERPI